MTLSPRRMAALASLLPGALFGAHLTGLLFFLNPDLDLVTPRVIMAVAVYSGVLGLVSACLLSPWTLLSPKAVLRSLPWLTSAVLVSVSAALGFHASYYAYFLPPGVNIRLIKAAIVLGVAGLIAFYTALLHTLAARRYGWRSQLCFWALALGSLYVMLERREAYRPQPDTTLASTVEEPRPLGLIVVSLEGATLDVVLPLEEQGQLPFLAEALRGGSFARLRPQRPLRRDSALTTLVTGKWPFQHGIRDSARYRLPSFDGTVELNLLPAGLRSRSWLVGGAAQRAAIDSDRQASTAWEITHRLGLDAGMVGWPAVAGSRDPILFSIPSLEVSVPGESWGDDRIGSAASSYLDSLEPAVKDLVHTAVARDLRLTRQFVAHAGVVPSARALFLNLPGLSEVSAETLGAYSLAPFPGGGGSTFGPAAHAITGYYRWLDAVLEELWASTSQPAILVVVSPHGYRAPSWWEHRAIESRRRRGIADGEADGLLILFGRGIRASSYVADAGIEDVLPTLLYALGIPIARDLDGRILTGVFEPAELAARPLTFLPSYETLIGRRDPAGG